MPKQQLSFSEKLQLLSELKNFYMNKFGYIYSDIPEELGCLKGLTIGLIFDILHNFFEGKNNDPSEDEIFFVLSYVIDKDFISGIFNDVDEIEQEYIKMGFGCGIGILKGDKSIIKKEKKELEKAGGVEISCCLL